MAHRHFLLDSDVWRRRLLPSPHDKTEVVYAYLSGPEFKGRVSAIVDSFTSTREDLETEKKAIQKIWA